METVTLKTAEVSSALAVNDCIARLDQLPHEIRDGTGSAVWAELVESLRATDELFRLARALV